MDISSTSSAPYLENDSMEIKHERATTPEQKLLRPVPEVMSPPLTPGRSSYGVVNQGDFFAGYVLPMNVSPLRSPLGTPGRTLPNGSPGGRHGDHIRQISFQTSPRKSRPTSQVVWNGSLPPRNAKDSGFSNKVFLGGVPWDITETDLHKAFDVFGSLGIEWPGVHDRSTSSPPKGHVYILFDDELSVKRLLGSCSYDFHHGQHNWFYKVASKRMLVKSVQVIPWQLADATYTRPGCSHEATNATGKTKIFVANLHGMITAEGLAFIMDQLFGNVIAASLDTDKSKYPIGSGRVTFNNLESHMKAICAGTVDIRTAKFSRQIKIDPYLEDSICSICQRGSGPFFCRNLDCFDYFCRTCWDWQHSYPAMYGHEAMTRPARVSE